MDMARIRKPITVTLDPALVDRLDEWCRDQEIPPKRAQALDLAIREFLDKRSDDAS